MHIAAEASSSALIFKYLKCNKEKKLWLSLEGEWDPGDDRFIHICFLLPVPGHSLQA